MDTTQPPRIEPAEQGSPNRQNVKRPETVDGHERDRDFLSEAEVEVLLAAARKDRFGTRDHTAWYSRTSAKRFDGVWE